MNRVLTGLLTLMLLIAFSLTAAAQNANENSSSTTTQTAGTKKKRGPIFRATKDQIKQAQALLKQRGFYAGEQTGQLNDDTRAGLRKYQEAESIKITGTLNKVTLEKMGITLTEKQKAM
ncbi:MAG: peptidoglycan-binding protein [Pyrinomonadaceae bacterium]|nr:peptidoglycan-binding protein [Pyrinomonadaceae bacterium]